nr:hypothetical protein [Tanacetum cinerariifolium]
MNDLEDDVLDTRRKDEIHLKVDKPEHPLVHLHTR